MDDKYEIKQSWLVWLVSTLEDINVLYQEGIEVIIISFFGERKNHLKRVLVLFSAVRLNRMCAFVKSILF